MIQTFALKRLQNGELISFLDSIITLCSAPDLPVVVVNARDVLKRTNSQMQTAHVVVSKLSLFEEARSLDSDRDEQVIGLANLCRAFTTNRSADKRAAGQLILDCILSYGSPTEIASQGLDNETADIKGILEKFRTDHALGEAIHLIGATDWVQELSRINTEFVAKRLLLNEKLTALASTENIESLRPLAMQQYRSLCQNINSFNITSEGAEPWPGIIDQMNQLINSTRTRLAVRKGRAASENSPQA